MVSVESIPVCRHCLILQMQPQLIACEACMPTASRCKIAVLLLVVHAGRVPVDLSGCVKYLHPVCQRCFLLHDVISGSFIMYHLYWASLG